MFLAREKRAADIQQKKSIHNPEKSFLARKVFGLENFREKAENGDGRFRLVIWFQFAKCVAVFSGFFYWEKMPASNW